MRAVLAQMAATLAPASRSESKSSSPGLRIGEPDDAFEREADRLADEAMSGAGLRPVWSFPRVNDYPPVPRKCECGGTCDKCREHAELHRKTEAGHEGAGALDHAPAVVEEALATAGQPLAPEVRGFFESRFQFDFTKVRVHSGAKAEESADAVAARAYTVGTDIVFGAGHYAPQRPEGRKLMAHELAHVVQQAGTLRTKRVQRDSPKAKPKPECVKAGDLPDGYGAQFDPPIVVLGHRVEYAITGNPKPGESREDIERHVNKDFVDSHYGDLGDEQKAAALNVLNGLTTYRRTAEFKVDCVYVIWLQGDVMDRLLKVTGVELRVEKTAREKKEKEREETRKAGGKAAENREKKAGLPPPPNADQQTGSTAKSGSEYTGPSEKKGNAPALPAEMKGPELQPTHGTGTYTMELNYGYVGADLLSQVVEAMNWVNYHWERYDITDLVEKGMTEEDKNKMKQQAPSKEAEVGKMAAAGRRAEYKYEDLKEQSETSLDDLMHPTQSATTGSAVEIATKAIANYDNLVLLPASAIISAGGWALGALADLFGGTEQEREIPWPEKPGYYFVRCIAQPDPQGEHGEQRRTASVAVKTVRLRNLADVAKHATVEDDVRVAEKNAELEIARHKQPNDPQEIQKLTDELAGLNTRASGSAEDVIAQTIKDKEKELDKATSEYAKAKLQDEIDALIDQGMLAEKRAKALSGGKPMRPKAHLVSKITGQVYPLLLQLGSEDPSTKKFAFGLSDVTSRDGSLYRGEEDSETAAAWNAMKDFAWHNEYGEGIIVVSVPPGSSFQFPTDHIDSKPHDTAIAKQRIDDLVKVLVILGLFVPGVGEVAMVLGAAEAAAHLIERWQNGALRADASAISDILGVLGAVFAGANFIGELRVVRTSESFLLRTAASIGEAEAGNKVLNYGGMIWGSLQDLNDIMADNAAELRGDLSHAEARRNRANKLANALQTGALVLGPTKGHEAEDEPTAKGGTEKAPVGEKPAGGEHETAKAPEQKPAEQKPAEAEPKDPTDRIILEGKTPEPLDPAEKTKARVRTADGLHQIMVLEDGRIIRCSLSCGELRHHYQEFIDSALKDDSDPARKKRAEDLDKRLKTAELGAKSENPDEQQSAAKDAAALEPELRDLAVKDLAGETGLKPDVVSKLSRNFTPDEIRDLRESLGDKQFAKFAKGEKVQKQFSLALAAAEADPTVQNAAKNIVKNGFGKVGDTALANALTDLAKLQSHVPGYITGDFLAEYEAKVTSGDLAGAKKLIKDSEPRFRDAQKAAGKAKTLELIAPLEARLTKQKEAFDEIRGKEREQEAIISSAKKEMDAAVERQDRAKTSEEKDQAHKDALAARDKMNAAKEALEKLSSQDEAADIARTKQAIEDVRLRNDPESRAPLPCFSGDTFVWTARGMRRIDGFRPGDGVYAFDFGSGRVVERRVLQVYRNRSEHFFLIRAGGETIRATGRHRFWIEGLHRWLRASELEPGMRLHARESDEAPVEAVSLEENLAAESWNLSVEENPNYFVGPGLLVHNQGGFDTKLGGDITIYRGTNPKYPDKVYIGKTTDVTAGGKSRGVDARQGEHQKYAEEQLQDRSKLSKEDIEFYEFMSGVELTELVTGLANKEQGQYLEQKNIEIERNMFGEKNVLNRRNEITTPERMKKISDSIVNDKAVKKAGFCTKA